MDFLCLEMKVRFDLFLTGVRLYRDPIQFQYLVIKPYSIIKFGRIIIRTLVYDLSFSSASNEAMQKANGY